MLKAEVSGGYVHINHVEGTGTVIMAEVCCLVNSVCQAFCQDEECAEIMAEQMILLIADALKANTEVRAKKVQK